MKGRLGIVRDGRWGRGFLSLRKKSNNGANPAKFPALGREIVSLSTLFSNLVSCSFVRVSIFFFFFGCSCSLIANHQQPAEASEWCRSPGRSCPGPQQHPRNRQRKIPDSIFLKFSSSSSSFPDGISSLLLVYRFVPFKGSGVFGRSQSLNWSRWISVSLQCPHMLFYGPPGTGKTTTALAIARQLYG